MSKEFLAKTAFDDIISSLEDLKASVEASESNASDSEEQAEFWATLAEVKNIQDWALSESFTITGNVSYDSDGNIESADIQWPDGEPGSISDVQTNEFGITSIRFNRPDSKYIEVTVTRDGDGNVTETTATAEGF